jgi:hypothetical protein
MSYVRRASLALVLLLAWLSPALANERIVLFISDADVGRDGDLLVTETIRVYAEGDQIKHGIFRDFPTNYTRPDGTRLRVGFDVLSVKRDDASEPFTTERIDNGVRVRIGKADQLLSEGDHDYEIRYRTTRQIGFFADHDELYWNATGNGWPFAIDLAEARIHLPEAVRFIQTAFYTGPQGATGKDARVVSEQPGTVVFRTTQVLPPYNGLTVAAAWPKGIITAPTDAQQNGSWLHDGIRSLWPAWVFSRSLPITATRGAAPGATRAAARSFRCLVRPTTCRRRRCAMCGAWTSMTVASPPPFSISRCTAISS